MWKREKWHSRIHRNSISSTIKSLARLRNWFSCGRVYYHPVRTVSSILIERKNKGERTRGRKRMGKRNRKHAVSGVGDFIKNSCVWELLSEAGLLDQGLCCQPSSGSTTEGRVDKDGSWRWWLEMKDARTSTMRTTSTVRMIATIGKE